MSRILDKSFKYVPAARSTPERLARVFAVERKRLADIVEKQKAAEAEAQAKIRTIKKGATA